MKREIITIGLAMLLFSNIVFGAEDWDIYSDANIYDGDDYGSVNIYNNSVVTMTGGAVDGVVALVE